ncbi:MAG: YiiD C-terminal domain-containing protein [Leptospiraceae bacterium]|nr:YiiD C-terminal domain-containing protein [Leptospiraceae bacterium]MCB1318697.1 YiiD C-terminal domain-containing protein [Leptospiraceae bacterium]
MSSRNRMEFGVDPHWQFLRDNYGMEEAFQFFGPYRGAGIIPTLLDAHTVEVRMPLEPANKNYVGTQFGGSLYSMCDPFFMFILMDNLGADYIVWDKSARIEFVQPGTGEVRVRFHIPEDEIQTVRDIVARDRKTTRLYAAEIQGPSGEVVARVTKELYIRKKRSATGN